MSHNVETMAYANEVPWHGLGKHVHPDLTPEQFLEEAGLDWTVRKQPNFIIHMDKDGNPLPPVANGGFSLVRESDNKVLAPHVGKEWHPVQNHQMAEFFHDFVMDNHISIETGGSLQDGKIVWFLGKTKRAFDLKFGRKTDTIENYLLFSLYHKFGFSTDIRNTDIRVVCNNTFSAAHGKDAEVAVKFQHKHRFDVEEAKNALARSYAAQSTYKQKAEFIASKNIGGVDVMDYFQDLFPGSTSKEYSRNALLCGDAFENQPGADLGEGTWWQAFNAVTYATDHLIGGDNRGKRLTSSWYGSNRLVKSKALELAIGYAKM